MQPLLLTHGRRQSVFILIQYSFCFHLFCAFTGPITSGELFIFFFFNVLCTYDVHFFSDKYRSTRCSGVSHPAAQNSRNSFLYDFVNICWESGCIATLSSSSSSVIFTCDGFGKTTLKAFVTDYESAVNTRRRRSLWKRNSSSCSHCSRRQYSELLKKTSFRFSKTEKTISGSLHGHDSRAIAVTSNSSGPWRGGPASENDFGFHNIEPSGLCDNNTY